MDIKIPRDLDKGFNYLETVLKRFSRRLHKQIVFANPPSILSAYCPIVPDDGIVLKMVAPCDGKITKTTFNLVTEKNVTVIVKISVSNIEYTDHDKEIPVKENDVITVKVVGQCSNVLSSLLFVADIKAADKENISIDTFDKEE